MSIKVNLKNVTVFRNEKDGRVFYRTTIGHKKQDNTFDNAGISIQFPKDVDLADRTVINSENAFLTFYKNKDGNPVYYIYVATHKEGQIEGPRGITLLADDQMIFRNEKDGNVFYRTTVGHKKLDGEYENTGITTRFKKGIELPDRAKVKISNAILDHYKNKEGIPVFYVMIFDFEIVG